MGFFEDLATQGPSPQASLMMQLGSGILGGIDYNARGPGQSLSNIMQAIPAAIQNHQAQMQQQQLLQQQQRAAQLLQQQREQTMRFARAKEASRLAEEQRDLSDRTESKNSKSNMAKKVEEIGYYSYDEAMSMSDDDLSRLLRDYADEGDDWRYVDNKRTNRAGETQVLWEEEEKSERQPTYTHGRDEQFGWRWNNLAGRWERIPGELPPPPEGDDKENNPTISDAAFRRVMEDKLDALVAESIKGMDKETMLQARRQAVGAGFNDLNDMLAAQPELQEMATKAALEEYYSRGYTNDEIPKFYRGEAPVPQPGKDDEDEEGLTPLEKLQRRAKAVQ